MPRFNPGDLVVFIGDRENHERYVNRSGAYTVGAVYQVRRWDEECSRRGHNSLFTVRDDNNSQSNGWRDYFFMPVSELTCDAQRRKLGLPSA